MNRKFARLKPLAILLAGVFATSAPATARAALTSVLGGQAVYDTDLNVTWLANANLSASNTFGVSGIIAGGGMTWNTAQSWIAAMNTANYLGYNDWRLPTTLQPDASCSSQSGSISQGYNCTGSEMGHLFYNELGGTAGSSILSSSDPDLALFQSGATGYWSGTEYAPGAVVAWSFNTLSGNQTMYLKHTNYLYAWAMRPGNSAAVSAVPEPEAVAMLLAGLGLMGFTARRRKARGDA